MVFKYCLSSDYSLINVILHALFYFDLFVKTTIRYQTFLADSVQCLIFEVITTDPLSGVGCQTVEGTARL